MVFALPFLLLVVFAGHLADRCSKTTILVCAKWAEVLVMALATWGLATQNAQLGLVALFLMGAQSAFLGPAKYGLLPELFHKDELPKANGSLQVSVMVGILLGTGCVGFLRQETQDQFWMAGVLFTSLALVGVFAAKQVQPQPPADPTHRLQFNPISQLRSGFRIAAQTPGLIPAMLGHGMFWLVGAMGLFAWNEIGFLYEFDEAHWTAGLASLSIAIGLGSWLGGRWATPSNQKGLIVGGAILLAGGYAAVALGPKSPWFIWGSAMLAHVGLGFYLLPLKTAIQGLPPQGAKGQIQGVSQLVDWLCIVGASLTKEALSHLEVTGTAVFGVMALGMLGASQIAKRAGS